MKPWKVQWREYESLRHGTQALIAAFHVVSGKVQGDVDDSRTEAVCVAYLEALFAMDGRGGIICDNLNTHVSKGLVRLGASYTYVEEAGLGSDAILFPLSHPQAAIQRARKRRNHQFRFCGHPEASKALR
jgi:hypothetical protein